MNEGIIKDIGRSYVVSSLIPSIIFLILVFIFFQDLLIEIYKLMGLERQYLYSSLTTSSTFLAIWLGFVLYSGQGPIVKFYEGYWFSKAFQTFLGKLRFGRKIKKFNIHFKEYKNWLNMPKKKRQPSWENSLNILHEIANEKMFELQKMNLPFDEDDLLPTRLGNALKFGELYPNERYGFDGVNIWPRLFHVVPKEYSEGLKELNNKLIFLLNSSFLFILLGSGAWFIYIYKQFCIKANYFCSLIPIDANIITENEYLIKALLLWLVAYILYLIGVKVAEDFSYYLISGFDLFRLNLVKQLNMVLPNSLKSEQILWNKIDEFYKSGEKFISPSFSYVYNETND